MNKEDERRRINFCLNGKPVSAAVSPFRRLLDLLREDFGLLSPKEACGEGECGACTVLLDGQATLSCLVLAGSVEGRSVVTLEGLADSPSYQALEEAFAMKGAVQCGFCTPGFLVSAHACLEEGLSADTKEIRAALDGNLCRCTGYVQILEAVREAAAARDRRNGQPLDAPPTEGAKS